MTTLALANIEAIEAENQFAGEGTGSLADQMQAAKTQSDLAFGCLKKSVEHVWLMGQALTKAKELHKALKKKNKTQPNWESVLDEHGISIPSDNRARRLYAGFPNVEQIQDRTIMEAYELVGITNSAKKKLVTNCEAAQCETSNAQRLSMPSSSPNDDDEWPDAKESDLIDSDDESDEDEDNGTALQVIEAGLVDDEEISNDVIELFDSLIEEVGSVQMSQLIDDHLDSALTRVEKLADLVIQIQVDLEARLTAHAAV